MYSVLKTLAYITTALALVACGGSASGHPGDNGETAVDVEGQVVEADSPKAAENILPYSDESIREHVVMDHGKRAVRSDADDPIKHPELVKNKQNLFIVMSKKDFYLYVYEAQGKDTVLIARYDCCFSLKKGQKERKGDMKTPHCTMKNPFKISQLADASTWHHDFGDGRGNIKAYGDYFLRLVTPGHSGIGIHGSTNNRESVPGRASEGCIRLKDEDIVDLRKNYAFVGMKVVIKSENTDDYPFEIRAMKKQDVKRKRHFDPKKTLTNEQIQKATTETFSPKTGGDERAEMEQEIQKMTENIPVDDGNDQAAADKSEVPSGLANNMTAEEYAKVQKQQQSKGKK